MEVKIEVSSPVSLMYEAVTKLSELLVAKGVAEATRKHLNEEIAKSAEAVRHLIREGHTTGDRLVDLVLLAGGGLNDPALPRLRELEGGLKGKKGEFVFMRFSDDIPYKHTFGQGYESRTQSLYRLGVLEGEKLKLAGEQDDYSVRGQLVLPVSRYIGGLEEVFFPKRKPKLEIKERNIFAHGHGGFGHDGCPPLLTKIEMLSDEAQEGILIGDEPVKKWLKAHAMVGLYKPAADALSKLILEPTD